MMNSLKKYSNDELELRLKSLVAKERELLHLILEHIKEVDTRKLYLERAYSSLYEYLIKELKYSGSSAMRRIEAARLLKDIPDLSAKIQAGSLNLTQLGELSRAVKEKEKATHEKISAIEKQNLVARITGKSSQETQKELALALDLQLKEHESLRTQKDESVRLELTLSKEQNEKLLKCRDKASHSLSQKLASSNISDVLELLMDHYLKEGTAEKTSITTAAVTARDNKTLTPKTREMILKRDQCCQYQDPKTGKVCGSTYLLQVDHIKPRWADGDHHPENLQAFCGPHNNLKYRKSQNLRFC